MQRRFRTQRDRLAWLYKKTLELMNTPIGIAVLLSLALIATGAHAVPETREECRASSSQQEIVTCIDRGLYDPCEDAGGNWGRAQCAWAHTEIATRRVKVAEQEVAKRLRRGRTEALALKQFKDGQKAWEAYRDKHCKFTNQTVELEQFNGTSFLHVGFCFRRLTEQRASELEAVLRVQE
jgi:uncharacterized protein YecT (DUF1311 family)